MAAVLINPSTSKRWTFADLAQFDESERYEIYDGKLIPMAPSPNTYHQRLLKRLFRLLDGFVESRQLGEVFVAPYDVVMADDNIAQPDLLFIAKEYWIIDPVNRSVEILALAEKRFVIHSLASETGTAESKVLAGLSIDVAALF
jgi:Uma2 family endonuclease